MLTTLGDRLQRRVWPVAALAGSSLLAAGCAGNDPYAGLDTVFCYRTLADVGCYPHPDWGREGQLVGVYMRDPEAPGAVNIKPVSASAPQPASGGEGWLRSWLSAPLDLAARVLAPVGAVIGLSREP
jgi:hypothetical protein